MARTRPLAAGRARVGAGRPSARSRGDTPSPSGIPSVEVHRRIRFQKSDSPRRLDAVGIGPTGLDLGENEVSRAVQDSFEGFDPRSAKGLLEQVEHGRSVHHGSFIAESDTIPAGDFAQATIVVH